MDLARLGTARRFSYPLTAGLGVPGAEALFAASLAAVWMRYACAEETVLAVLGPAGAVQRVYGAGSAAAIPAFEETPIALSEDAPLFSAIAAGVSVEHAAIVFEWPGEGQSSLRITVRLAGLEARTIDTLAAHWMYMVRALGEGGTPWTHVDLLTGAERAQLTETWAWTHAAFTIERPLHGMFAEVAARSGDAPAIVHEGDSISYAALYGLANRWARMLAEHGVQPGDRVALYLPRGIAMVAAQLAAMTCGAVFVPLDLCDPAPRRARILGDARPKVLLTVSTCLAALEEVDAPVIALDTVALDGVSGARFDLEVAVDAPLYVLYTSGSTGQPKGVCCTHRGVLNLLMDFQRIAPVAAGSACSHWTTFSFDVSIYETWTALLYGGVLHIVPEPLRASAAGVLDWLEAHAIATAYVPPFMLPLLAERLERRASGMRRLLVGVEPIADAPLQRMKRAQPDLCVLNGYGPTEATIWSTLHEVRNETPSPRVNAPIGRPVANTSAYVLDPWGNPVNAGMPGELYLGGAGVALGYFESDALTRARFVPDPFRGAGHRMYRTGDRVCWLDDGTLYFLGRADRQVKIRGFRVELGEIESVLRGFPGLADVVAGALRDPAGELTVVAWCVWNGAAPDDDALRAHMAAQLPAQFCPSFFLPLNAFPQTPQGKIDRKALPEPTWTTRDPSGALPPLLALWHEVLPGRAIAQDSHFFRLGGHSLQAARLVARISTQWQRAVPLDLVYRYPVYRDLARWLEETAPVPLEASGARADRTECGLTRNQQDMYLLERLYPGSATDHIPLHFRFEQPVDAAMVKAALAAVIQRHMPLHAAFREEGGTARQVLVKGDVRLQVEEIDDKAWGEIDARLPGLITAPFALAEGCLLRARLFRRRGSGRCRLLIVVHHLVFDGWSIGRFIEEVSIACTRGAEALPPIRSSYFAYVAWQAEQVRNGSEAARRYYLECYATLPEPLRWPGHAPVLNAMLGRKGKRLDVVIDSEAFARLEASAQAGGVSRCTVLLAAFGAAIGRLLKTREVVVGLTRANRNAVEFEELLGLFINTVPVRVSLSGDALPVEAVGMQMRALAPHVEIPMGLVQEWIQERHGRHLPVQALLLYQSMDTGLLRIGEQTAALEPVADWGRAYTDVTLEVHEEAGGLHGYVEYAADCISDAMAQALATAIVDALRAQDAAETRAAAAPRIQVTPMQRVMLRASQEGAAGTYLEQVVVAFSAPLHAADVKAAWRQVCGRHRTLLAHVELRSETLAILDADRGAAVIAEAALQGKFGACARAVAAQDAVQRFDLAHSLSRVTLIGNGDGIAGLLWTVHHALVDAQSMRIVLEDFAAVLNGTVLSVAEEGAAALVQYEAWLRGHDMNAARAFWVAQAPAEFQVVDFPRLGPAGDRSGISRAEQSVSATVLAPLLRQCEQHGVRLHAVLQTALALLMRRYTGQDLVAFGEIKSLREAAGIPETAAGLFINTIPLFVPVDGSMSALSLVERVSARWAAAREADWAPLNLIQSWLPPSEEAHAFPVYFMYTRSGLSAVCQAAHGALFQSIALLERIPIPFVVSCTGTEEVVVQVEFDAQRYPLLDAPLVAQHFVQIVRALGAGLETRVDGIGLWEAPDWRALLRPHEAAEAARGVPILEAIARAASLHADAAALHAGAETWTYARLMGRASQWCGWLRGRGVTRGSVVALHLTRSPEFVALALGVLKAGAAYLPMDWDTPLERVGFMAADAQAVLLVSGNGDVAKAACAVVSLAAACAEASACAEEEAASALVDSGDLAYVIYTSGSTGTPKGVPITHGALSAFVGAAGRAYGIVQEDRVLQMASLGFDAAVEEIFVTLSAGACLALRDDGMMASPRVFFERCRTWEISVLDLPTAFWATLGAGISPALVPPALRLVIIGGEQAHGAALAQWQEACAGRVRILNTYGPTEAAVVSLWSDITQSDPELPVPIGHALDSVCAWVLDRDGQPAPPGVRGELALAGPQLSPGYLGLPESSARVFPCAVDLGWPVAGGLRLYRTGDFAVADRVGAHYYLGRGDRQVKIRGYRVELEEVESLLIQLPGVREAAVTFDEVSGLTAHVTMQEGSVGGAELQRAFTGLATAAMQPSAWLYYESLPLTERGKVDYRALRAPERAVAGADSGAAMVDPYELRLLRLWQEVLGRRNFGREDHFFTSGGHSLLAMQLLGRIEAAFGVALPPLQAFQAPTIAAMAALLREEQPEAAVYCLERFNEVRSGRQPLFFIGSGNLVPNLSEAFGSDQPLYGLNVFGIKTADGTRCAVTVPEIAALYLREMRQVQPLGPYAIAAYCLDAALGLEMAQQLRAQGEEVSLLAFVDAVWPGDTTLTGWRRHVINVVEYGPAYVLSKVRQKRSVWRAMANRRAVQESLARAVAAQRPLSAMESNQAFMSEVFDVLEAYRMTRYAGVITLLIASEWRIETSRHWGRIAQGGLDVVPIRGFHDNLFEPPQVQAMCAALRKRIRSQA
ncbi:MAG: amino acid adenylation domain-containing protein [Candidatus Hydrogenedentes bacterium]|nr:amino acid adenylation domain-containing protein [Candidatus Hydrogenedentota bacterium]